MNFHLITARLQIRPVAMSDVDDIFLLQRSVETARFNTSPIPGSVDDSRIKLEEWIAENEKENPRQYTFSVMLADQHTFIGLTGIKLGKEHYKNGEVWFQYSNKFWNKGYATESLEKLLDFGFEKLGLHRIEAGCAVDNIGSIRVLEKAGMRREARRRQLLPLPSGWSDNFGYAIISTDER